MKIGVILLLILAVKSFDFTQHVLHVTEANFKAAIKEFPILLIDFMRSDCEDCEVMFM